MTSAERFRYLNVADPLAVASSNRAPARIAFVLPHLAIGGIESGVVRYVNGLDRDRFVPLVVVRGADGPLRSRLASDVTVLDAGGRRSALLAPWLARLFRREAVDLVYAGTNAVNVAVLLAARLMPRPERPRLLISEHTSAAAYLATAKLRPVRRRLLRALYPGADALVTPLAEVGHEWMETLELEGLRLAVCPNPVIDEHELAAHVAGVHRRPGLVVAAGRLVPDKGFDLLVRAFAIVARRRPAARLVIFGEGDERPALKRLVASLDLTSNVRLAGWSSRLPAELAAGELFVSASRREGFGNVLVEALAVGTPVVATRCVGSERILDGGRFGTLVPVGDAEALARAMLVTLDNAASREHAVRLGRERAADFTVERAVARFIAVVDEELGRAGGGVGSK